MKLRTILLLIALTGLCHGQVKFTPEISTSSEKAKITVRPYYFGEMYKNYRNIEVKTPPAWADKFAYEWAIEHKTLPLELWLHISPGSFAFTIARVNALAEDLLADLVTDIYKVSDELLEKSRCTFGHWARVSGIDPSFTDKSGAIIMSYYKEDCGLMEYYLVFDEDQYDKVEDEIGLMMLAFCFKPEPKDDESAGIGVKISFNYDKNRFWFQEVGKGAPAYEAGFLPGDIILAIDNKSNVHLEDSYSITNMLKGIEGTEVNVAVYRDGMQYEHNIIRSKYLPEQTTFLTTGSREVILAKVKKLSDFILLTNGIYTQKGRELNQDFLGNRRWESKIIFPGGYSGVLTYNTYLVDRYELSFRLTNEENSDEADQIYNFYKSIISDCFSDEYDVSESRDNDGIMRIRVTDTIEGVSGNYIMLSLDSKSSEKSVTIEFIFPQ